jgi:hypothetical protein
MADLEDRIAKWRNALATAMADRPDVVDELEDHLRQDLDALTRAGRTPDEAWDTAILRLGDCAALAREFARSARAGWLPTRRVALVLLGVCGLPLVALLLAVVVSAARLGPLLAGHIVAITIAYGATFAFGLGSAAAIVAHARGSFGPAQAAAFRHAGTRLLAWGAGLTIVGIVLGALWLRASKGHYWGWDPREIGGLCVLGWDCAVLACLRRRRGGRGPHAAMIGGVLGNAVVGAAWFAPALMEPPRPGLPGWYASVLILFVMSQFAIALGGLLPAGWWASRRARGPGAA